MARTIFIAGAGRSSASLVDYLLDHAADNDWKVVVGDQKKEWSEARVKGHPNGKAVALNALDENERRPYIQEADLVISMLPARWHIEVLKDCIAFKKPLIAPSYVSNEIKALSEEIEAAGIPVVMEIGLDPGIDHMSAMEVIDRIRDAGHSLQRFESFTGGLVAPESDNNPWNYKFTWNPRNVVLAGQGGAARFIQEGKYKYVPYHQLFKRTKPIFIDGYGEFEGYSNRDSLQYKKIYNLGNIPTLYRGTIRRMGFSEAWDVFVQLGMTDDTYQVDDCESMTWREFANLFLAYSEDDSVEEKLQAYTGANDEVMKKLEWLGLFSTESIEMESGTPAEILQKLLESKWSLSPKDKDMIVMWHRFNYMENGVEKEIHSSMVVIGDDEEHTAMAKTVGLPVAIAARLILQGELQLKGIQWPTNRKIYMPILEELKTTGIFFTEKEIS